MKRNVMLTPLALMEQETKSRRWRYGAVVLGVGLLIALAAVYHFDLLEREPYPVLRSELQVEDMRSGIFNPRFGWLDNDRVVALVGERPDPLVQDRKRMIHAMKVWNVRTNDVRTLVADDVDALCLADGYFRIMVRKNGPEGKAVLEFYAGREGELKKVPPGRFDYMSCRPLDEVPLPEWTNAVRDPAINLRRLRPEHGFLVIDRDSPTDWPRSIRLYRPGEEREQGVNVSGMLGDRVPYALISIHPHYYAFKGAYDISSEGIGKGSGSVWLYPNGRIEPNSNKGRSELRPTGGIGTQSVQTNAGKVFGASRSAEDPIGDGGLFLHGDNPETPAKRIRKGRIGQELDVSPDGCQVAFANDERKHIDKNMQRNVYKLQVINLCPEKQP